MPDISRPKVLYLVHRVPYPPDKGDRIRNFHILSWLARRASVHLACLADESVDHVAVKTLETLVDRVAVVRLRAAQRWAGAAWSLVRGGTVTEGAFDSPEFRSLLRRWVGETRYDVVLASASSLVPYLRLQLFNGVPAVVDFVDVDSQKWLDYAQTCQGLRAWLYQTEGHRLRRLERDATTWARGVVLVSEAEANLFRHTCDVPNVYTVSNGVDHANFHPAPRRSNRTGRACSSALLTTARTLMGPAFLVGKSGPRFTGSVRVRGCSWSVDGRFGRFASSRRSPGSK